MSEMFRNVAISVRIRNRAPTVVSVTGSKTYATGAGHAGSR
jgi:hypothetical protein